jgi:uncharacterized protein
MKKLARVGAILCMLGTAAMVAAETIATLHPTNYVNDFAGAIDAKAKKRLNALCIETDRKTHAQIALVTINSTDGSPIGDYAHLLFNKWGIGNKKDNRGMLVLLSIKDRNYYIATGRGFETLFPDQRVAGIGMEMVPDLKKHRYAEALLHVAGKIATIIATDHGVTLNSIGPGPTR